MRVAQEPRSSARQPDVLQVPRLAARLLAPDLACVRRELAAALRSGAVRVHVDVMGPHDADVTMGPCACRALRREVRAALEAHLVVKPSRELIASFAEAGADAIAFHPEASEDVRQTIALVKAHGCEVGLALVAGDSLGDLEGLLGDVDLVLVTGATPGLDGRRFTPSALRWIRALRARVDGAGHPVAISVDGGVAADNAADLVDAGADALVIESVPCPTARARGGRAPEAGWSAAHAWRPGAPPAAS